MASTRSEDGGGGKKVPTPSKRPRHPSFRQFAQKYVEDAQKAGIGPWRFTKRPPPKGTGVKRAKRQPVPRGQR